MTPVELHFPKISADFTSTDQVQYCNRLQLVNLELRLAVSPGDASQVSCANKHPIRSFRSVLCFES